MSRRPPATGTGARSKGTQRKCRCPPARRTGHPPSFGRNNRPRMAGEGPRASWSSIPAQRSTAKQSACPRANGEPSFHEDDAVLPWTAQPPRARVQTTLRCCQRSRARPPRWLCLGTVERTQQCQNARPIFKTSKGVRRASPLDAKGETGASRCCSRAGRDASPHISVSVQSGR